MHLILGGFMKYLINYNIINFVKYLIISRTKAFKNYIYLFIIERSIFFAVSLHHFTAFLEKH